MKCPKCKSKRIFNNLWSSKPSNNLCVDCNTWFPARVPK